MPNLQWLANSVEGTLLNAEHAEIVFSALQIDSRKVDAGDLFVALVAARDGHDFAAQAMENGAVAVLVSKPLAVDIPQVMVADTKLAMAHFSAAWRQQFAGPVIALTGSAGKTTTKELIAAILREHYTGKPVLATQGNLNNDLGVPMTLSALNASKAAAVIEMGANHAGEIEQLTRWVAPSVGLITNAGTAHLEGFGSRDGVANAKGEIYQQLGADAVAVVNADSHYLPMWLNWIGGRKHYTFGLQQGDFTLAHENITVTQSGLQFGMQSPEGVFEVQLALSGEHNVANALAAVACCYGVGVRIETCVSALAYASGAPGRMQRINTPTGVLIDDSYNANPESVKAAIRWLAMQPLSTLVLGDMAELGENAVDLHREMGAYALAQGVTKLITVGDTAQQSANAFGEDAVHCPTIDAAVVTLQAGWDETGTVLVKGSRAARMERVIEKLQEKMGAA